MDSSFRRILHIGYEMTFEKEGCEIKKRHKKMKKPASELLAGHSSFPHEFLARKFIGNYNREKIHLSE